MKITSEQNPEPGLTPERIQEKANILETNLFKYISRLIDPSILHVKINRELYPDEVINKALLQLMPRFNIKPREYVFKLMELLKKNIPQGQQETVEASLTDARENPPDDATLIIRNFEAIATPTELEIFVKGLSYAESIDGAIAKSFFAHEYTPGKLSKTGVIDFKELNNYPIINAGDNLLYITNEIQGRQGLSFDGTVIPVEEAKPLAIKVGPGVKRIDDLSEIEQSKGYLLQAAKTGVIILERNAQNALVGIDISDEIETKKLDYSTGNVGTQYTCPISMKIGVICNGFKIRVNGKVEANVVDGGDIITNDKAILKTLWAGSSVRASKDIHIESASRSQIISEHGTVTITKELIDSKISSPTLIFKKNKGLITNNTLEANSLSLAHLYFSGENIIHFGHTLFKEKEGITTALKELIEKESNLKNTQNLLMGTLQLELKRLIKLTLSNPDLAPHIKQLILATHTMDYDTINREMAVIQKKNNTKVVATVKNLFNTLEKIPHAINICKQKESGLNKEMVEINQRMTSMTLSIEGFLRRAATIKIFTGRVDDKKTSKPDFMTESSDKENQYINVTATYSLKKGFEFKY
ncbi:flagellar assembly protein A [Desulfobacula sp.]|uniref:flagellar assembly protein A n=1 Tax=Desulfobacula sp. TaxID=2593537 RepID=UPI00261DDA59|nr:flagellar assembly protein A [Desulfobacula sp.]